MSNTNSNGFDGEDFAGLIIVVILIGLVFFGSQDIEGLTAAPTE